LKAALKKKAEDIFKDESNIMRIYFNNNLEQIIKILV